MSAIFSLIRGHSPLLVSMPHSGTRIERSMRKRMTPAGLRLADTDWHVPRLYSFLEGMGANIIVAHYSRYVVDLNRPPDGAALYPGQSETSVCPVTTFADEAIYRPGGEPAGKDIAARVAAFWQPYHQCLQSSLSEIRDELGGAILWDAHSIPCRVPRFFAGKLPDLSLGTAEGQSCGRALSDAVLAVMSKADFSVVRNGRFKGGHITRAYGTPQRGIHALQLEIAQDSYMNEADGSFDETKAARLRPVLEEMLATAISGIETSANS